MTQELAMAESQEGPAPAAPADAPEHAPADAPAALADAPAVAPAPATPPIQIRAITVRTGRIVADIAIQDERCRRTTPKLAALAQGHFPDLPHHACVNDVGFTFGDVIEATPVPHLLEHVVISLQVRERAIGDPTFIGTTEWTDEAAGEARVEFGFQDDLVALRALDEATKFLNAALAACFQK